MVHHTVVVHHDQLHAVVLPIHHQVSSIHSLDLFTLFIDSFEVGWNLQQPQIVYSPAPYANPMPTVSYAQGGIQQPPYPPQNIATGSSASQIQPNVPTAPSEDQSTIDEPPPSYGSLFPKEKKKTS